MARVLRIVKAVAVGAACARCLAEPTNTVGADKPLTEQQQKVADFIRKGQSPIRGAK